MNEDENLSSWHKIRKYYSMLICRNVLTGPEYSKKQPIINLSVNFHVNHILPIH